MEKLRQKAPCHASGEGRAGPEAAADAVCSHQARLSAAAPAAPPRQASCTGSRTITSPPLSPWRAAASSPGPQQPSRGPGGSCFECQSPRVAVCCYLLASDKERRTPQCPTHGRGMSVSFSKVVLSRRHILAVGPPQPHACRLLTMAPAGSCSAAACQ